ncbi:MAG: VCBS repeat-containing protein [Rhizorhabdus sp.]
MGRLFRWLAILAGLAVPVASQAAPLHFGSSKTWLTVPMSSGAAALADRVMFGRVNGDARMDVVLYNSTTGEAFAAISDGTKFGKVERVSYGLPKFGATPFQAALDDVNGDGLDDLVIMNAGADDVPGAATAVVAINQGAGHFTFQNNPVWNPSWCASYQVCLSGDLNADRRSDLVAFTPDYGIVYGTLSGGGSFGANSVFNRYFCIRGEQCALGDVDGDGRKDAMAFKPRAPGTEKGNVLWARSTGTAFTDVKLAHGFFCIDTERCMVGDVNGDRKDDIVLAKLPNAASTSHQILVSLSNGTQFINASPFEWGQIPFLDFNNRLFGSYALADVTGDGKADFISYGQITNRVGGATLGGGKAIVVFAVTDQAPAPPPPPPPASNPTGFQGWGSIAIYNCHPFQDRVHYWVKDVSSPSPATSSALTDAMYGEDGRCPDPGDAPFKVAMTAGHIYQVVVVDPSATGCEGRNDPNIVGCVTGSLAVKAASGGPVCAWVVSAQDNSCALGLAARSTGSGTEYASVASRRSNAPPQASNGFDTIR